MKRLNHQAALLMNRINTNSPSKEMREEYDAKGLTKRKPFKARGLEKLKQRMLDVGGWAASCNCTGVRYTREQSVPGSSLWLSTSRTVARLKGSSDLISREAAACYILLVGEYYFLLGDFSSAKSISFSPACTSAISVVS